VAEVVAVVPAPALPVLRERVGQGGQEVRADAGADVEDRTGRTRAGARPDVPGVEVRVVIRNVLAVNAVKAGIVVLAAVLLVLVILCCGYLSPVPPWDQRQECLATGGAIECPPSDGPS
jgi:hypothetical protein